MRSKAININKLKPKIRKELEAADISKAHTLEEWEAIEAAERKTLKGKLKYAWQAYLYHPAYRAWQKPFSFRRNVKYFIQRGKRGYSDFDGWCLDYYLSEWLPQALRGLKDGVSYPGHGEANTQKKWNGILEKMAKGFDAALKIREFPDKRDLKKLQKQQKEGLELFAKWFDALWD